MIYLTFDSNIWIYSLDESWQIENILVDYLEPWIQNQEVKLLLPKIIIEEWDKNEKEQVRNRELKLKEFFGMAEEILPSAFFAEYKETSAQSKIIHDQLNRVKNLILNCEIIPDYLEVKDRIISDGIAKKAPMHKKSSVSDAMIVYSLIHFSKLNQGNHYFFISKNTEDFYQKVSGGKKEIHHDLKQDFELNNIQAFTSLNELIYFLRTAHGLKVDTNINLKRKERIRNKIKEKVYNPEYDKLFESNENSYIQNLNTIEFILKETRPTKEQVILVLALIDSDISYERDFYKRLEKSSWFEILKRKGVFKTENTNIDNSWIAFTYLEKLSLQIKNGFEVELIDEIISIINNISQQKVDNSRLWFLFIKILSNLPNEKIPLDTLNFIPIWLKGKFNTILESSELCENLLSKFLSDNVIKENIEKAELILQNLFSIEKIEMIKESAWGVETESYRSRVYMHSLTDNLINRKLNTKIATYCSEKVIIDLAEKIKVLRFDFPRGITFSLVLKGLEFSINSVINEENLYIEIFDRENEDKTIGKGIINQFENLTEEQTKDAIVTILKEFGIEYEKNKDNEYDFRMFTNALTNGSHYYFPDDSISKFNEHYSGDRVVEAFSQIFVDLLNNKAKLNKEVGYSLLKLFVYNNKYRLPFFRKVVLFLIGENWELYKNLFWEIIGENDPMILFSNPHYYNDLYELLNNNQKLMNHEEIATLERIISFGSQDKEDQRDSKSIKFWQLRWYSALRNNLQFIHKYEALSQELNLTYENYQNLGVISLVDAPESPLNIEKIIQMESKDVADYIYNFKPKDRWDNPSISGLSSILGKAVEREPQKFSNELEVFKDVYFIYAYHIADGFKEAWKNKKTFNWKNVLSFYRDYITDARFYTDEFKIESDSWNATTDWVIGSVGDLLAEGMRSDANAFDLSHLPEVKDILKTLVERLYPSKELKETNINYATYSLNSTGGKTLRTLLDYSLRRARTLKAEDNLPRWEEDIKIVFEGTFSRGIIDGFILTGWYFQQFYYLDKKWIINKVKEFSHLQDKEWNAFIGGFSHSNPPFNKEIYEVFYPHYERGIKINKVIISHLTAFYFWDFEDLIDDGLVLKLLEYGSNSSVLNFVNFVGQKNNGLQALMVSDIKRFEEKILKLWHFIVDKFHEGKNEEEKNILERLLYFIDFITELNSEYLNLILVSTSIKYEYFHSQRFLENLQSLKNKGELNETAQYIATILNSAHFNFYLSTDDTHNIKELVIYLFKNNQRNAANEFCNQMVKGGHEFLISIHNEYKHS